MKKIIQVTIAILIIGAIAYYYLNQKAKPLPENKQTILATTTRPLTMGDNMFIAATTDADAQILARGDLNNDTFEDAIVAVAFCGASCSLTLNIVLNIENKATKTLDDVNFQGYKSSSATKSDVSLVTIKDGIITLTGKGLDCDDECTEEKWNIEKTIQYRLEKEKVVRITPLLTN